MAEEDPLAREDDRAGRHARTPGRRTEHIEAAVEKALGFGGGPIVEPLGFQGETNVKHAGAGIALTR